MATVRVFKELLRDSNIGKRIVPIIPDEARTFGMDSWFPTLKIYNRNGQLYTAVDAQLMLAYKESETGQILHGASTKQVPPPRSPQSGRRMPPTTNR